MKPEFLLSPFCFDQESPLIGELLRPAWTLHRATPAGAHQLTRMAGIHTTIRDFVADVARGRATPVSVAGDCCATIPVLAGLQRAGVNPIVVWLDAHGDFNTPDTTISGFLGGMPLAMMTGRGTLSLLKAVGAHPILDSDVFLADGRDLDPAERALLQGSGVTRLAALGEVMDALPPARPIYVHLDMDVIDSAEAPAMRYPVAHGPSAAAVSALCRALHDSGRIAAVSVTTWELADDRTGQTRDVCLKTLSALVGEDL